MSCPPPRGRKSKPKESPSTEFSCHRRVSICDIRELNQQSTLPSLWTETGKLLTKLCIKVVMGIVILGGLWRSWRLVSKLLARCRTLRIRRSRWWHGCRLLKNSHLSGLKESWLKQRSSNGNNCSLEIVLTGQRLFASRHPQLLSSLDSLQRFMVGVRSLSPTMRRWQRPQATVVAVCGDATPTTSTR